MKNLLLVALCSLLWTANDQIPAAVQARFQAMFPKAEEVQWKQEKEDVVAFFKHYSSLKEAVFTPEGEWRETRIQRAIWSCPDPVIAYMDLNLKGATVTSAAKVIDQEGVTYRVEAEYPEKIVILILNEGGYLLEEQSIPFAFELNF